MNIAFIGLGTMGLPMACNLIKAGHRLSGFDPVQAAVERFRDAGGTPSSCPGDASREADVVITMLPVDAVIRHAVFGPGGIVEGIRPGALHVDMSTAHPLESDRMRLELAERDIPMVDAPVGRTAAHAATGNLLVLAGATPEQLETLAPVFDVLGEQTIDCGGPGRGIRMKIVNNFMSIALNALSSEALVLCDVLGLPRGTAISMMQGTPAGKGHFTTTYPKKVFRGDTQPDFALRLAHKDLGLVLDLAEKLHLDLPLGRASTEIYNRAMEAGLGTEDWTAILSASERFLPGEQPGTAE
jgi:4-hydroxybutyrate dehydrogenase / sulfolactaldehyde 3-reductase